MVKHIFLPKWPIKCVCSFNEFFFLSLIDVLFFSWIVVFLLEIMVGEFLQVWILEVFPTCIVENNTFLRDESANHSPETLRKDPEGLKLQPVMKQLQQV